MIYIYKIEDNFIFINGIIQFFILFNAIYYFLKKSFMKLILISYLNRKILSLKKYFNLNKNYHIKNKKSKVYYVPFLLYKSYKFQVKIFFKLNTFRLK